MADSIESFLNQQRTKLDPNFIKQALELDGDHIIGNLIYNNGLSLEQKKFLAALAKHRQSVGVQAGGYSNGPSPVGVPFRQGV